MGVVLWLISLSHLLSAPPRPPHPISISALIFVFVEGQRLQLLTGSRSELMSLRRTGVAQVRAGTPCRARVQQRAASAKDSLSVLKLILILPAVGAKPGQRMGSSHPRKQLSLVTPPWPPTPSTTREAGGGRKLQPLETEPDCKGTSSSAGDTLGPLPRRAPRFV